MEIADWRAQIDRLDQQLVELLNQRCQYAQEIGYLKRGLGAAIYEPAREQQVLEHVRRCNRGPLSHPALQRIFERIIDEMRSIQKYELLGDEAAAGEHARPAHPADRGRGSNS